jgi:hypothetical protein
MLDGRAMTSKELADVARVLMNGLTLHAKEAEEVFILLIIYFLKLI